MSTKTYAPDQVKVILGAVTIQGYAEDNHVKVENLGDGITSVTGLDGEVSRTLSRDRRLRITLTLSQTSDSNDVLSALLTADELSGGNGMVPFAMNDLRGRTLYAAESAWVTKLATSGYGKAIGTREWIIETGTAASFVGGNS